VALALVILQTLILVAGLALLGQLMVGLFAWGRRSQNLVYQLLGIIASPAVKLARKVSPRVVLDEHVPAVAFLLLLIGYFVVGFFHRDLCLSDLTQTGCARWAAARGVQ
jgi:uncharacterized protein YggT (Ycf19 family)